MESIMKCENQYCNNESKVIRVDECKGVKLETALCSCCAETSMGDMSHYLYEIPMRIK